MCQQTKRQHRSTRVERYAEYIHNKYYLEATMFSALPSDCLDAILSFLPLESMIQLGATSTRCLSDIQPEIQRRRQRFNQTFCYSSTLDRPKAQLYSRGLCEIHLLPTVRDRIDSLFKVLATSHPCYHQVAELREAITRVDVEPLEEGAKEDIMSLLKRHSDNARPHMQASCLEFESSY